MNEESLSVKDARTEWAELGTLAADTYMNLRNEGHDVDALIESFSNDPEIN